MSKTGTAQKAIEIALSQVGYLEKKTNAQLDDFKANAGSGNFTKYGRDTWAWRLYNGNKNGFAWCDQFVDWCFMKAWGGDVKAMMAATFQPMGGGGAGCDQSMGYYKKAGAFHKSPLPGDQIFFGVPGDATHTGLVIAVDKTKVYTVEGNTSSAAGVVANGGAVAKKSYALNYSKILGYGRPKYKEVEEMTQADFNKMLAAAMPVYNTFEEIPEWYKPTIQKLVAKGYLKGDGGGFNISEEMTRMLVINDRAGIYG